MWGMFKICSSTWHVWKHSVAFLSLSETMDDKQPMEGLSSEWKANVVISNNVLRAMASPHRTETIGSSNGQYASHISIMIKLYLCIHGMVEHFGGGARSI